MEGEGVPSSTGSRGHMKVSSPTLCRETESKITQEI